jgi:molybdenum cofactor cytidylyltransferase
LFGELMEARRRTGKAIVASAYGDAAGVPALFSRTCFSELLAVPDAEGARRIITRDPALVERVPFDRGAFDIDTPADWAALP